MADATIRFFYHPMNSFNASAIEPTFYRVAQAPFSTEALITTELSKPIDLKKIHQHRAAIARSTAFYGKLLDTIDPAGFQYLDESQRVTLEQQLFHTLKLIHYESQLFLFEKNWPTLRQRAKQLECCAQRLHQLRNTGNPLQLLELERIAPILSESMSNVSAAEWLDAINQSMTDVNMYRLNWVWGGGLDQSLLAMLPAYYKHREHAQRIFDALQPVTGYMSFILYYARLGIRLYLLAEGTINGSWMDPWSSDDDRAIDITLKERFEHQWEERKFDLINDFFWATANMACFLWLVKNGVWGCTVYMGNALTVLLLLMDLSIVYKDHHQKKANHDGLMQQYKEDITVLNEQLQALVEQSLEQQILQAHLSQLIEAQTTDQLNWEIDQQTFDSDRLYAAGLIAAFVLMCCCFFPPSAILPATQMLLGVLGSALSFAFTLAHNAMAIHIETNALIKQHHGFIEQQTALQEKQQIPELDNNQRATVDLALQQLNQKIMHQTQLLDYQTKRSIQQLVSETMLPATVFACLVFLPLNVGLPIMLPVVALLLLSSTLLEHYYEPKDPNLIQSHAIHA